MIPDYSQLSVHSARTLTALVDVNTKLYIGTEVNIPTNKVKIEQHITTLTCLKGYTYIIDNCHMNIETYLLDIKSHPSNTLSKL